MFWRVAGLSTTSPVESVLDKEVFTLEELLDEDEIIQECKALNSRLINFLRGKAQVQQMLRYVIEEPPEGAEDKRAFKFPFIACEVFTCEIDAIFKTLGEDEEVSIWPSKPDCHLQTLLNSVSVVHDVALELDILLMNMLFSFLDPSRPHGTLLAGYFSKVVICLLLSKTVLVMRYLRAHQEILKKLVDLNGITSIMEVLVRLVGADEHIYAFHADALQWLAETDLLEMLVDKLSPPHSSEVHANAAETLAAVSRIAPSALASKLASSKFVAKLFNHVLEDPSSKSTLIHSLSVCISLLDPKRAATVARGQHPTEPLPTANPETVDGMLQRLGDLLQILDLSMDDKILPTTYGQLRPPVGIHRLKIVEFIAVLLRTNSEGAIQELVRLRAIEIILNLFFKYPFNNMLHHHVESIITSCLESNSPALVDHLLKDCDFIARVLAADDNPFAPDTRPEPWAPTNKSPPRIGNMGHLTRIANKFSHATNPLIQGHLQANPRWNEWQATALETRNRLENVFQWTCGRPVKGRPVNSDEDNFRDRDYDISTMAGNLTREVYRYGMFENEDVEEDAYFDDESAEVVISSLRLGDESDRNAKEIYGGNKNWFAFQDESRSKQPLPSFLISPPSQRVNDEQVINVVSPPHSSGGSSIDDEVVVGEDEDLADTATSPNASAPGVPGLEQQYDKRSRYNAVSSSHPTNTSVEDISTELEKLGLSDNLFSLNHTERNLDLFASKSVDWDGLQEHEDLERNSGSGSHKGGDLSEADVEKVDESSAMLSERSAHFEIGHESSLGSTPEASPVPLENHRDPREQAVAPLFGGPPIIGVEPEGTAMAMEKALKEGIVGEAGPIIPGSVKEDEVDRTDKEAAGNSTFNDVNFWRSDYDQSVADDIKS